MKKKVNSFNIFHITIIFLIIIILILLLNVIYKNNYIEKFRRRRRRRETASNTQTKSNENLSNWSCAPIIDLNQKNQTDTEKDRYKNFYNFPSCNYDVNENTLQNITCSGKEPVIIGDTTKCTNFHNPIEGWSIYSILSYCKPPNDETLSPEIKCKTLESGNLIIKDQNR